MSLRWRLALLSCTVAAVMIVATFLGLFLAVRATLNRILNDGLSAQVNWRIDEEARRAAYPRSFPRPDPDPQSGPKRVKPPGLAIMVSFDPGGKLQGGERPVTAPLKIGFASVGGYRVLTGRAANGVWIQAFRPENEYLSSVRGVLHIFLLIAPLIALLSLVGGYLLADRALRPVDAVTRLAGRIADSGRYAERVPPAPGRDEMARLTLTINRMLDRLSGLIERERTFAMAAAHELRTPLAVIRARASLTLERERDPARYRAALGEVRDVSTELTRLADRLLALARTGGPARLERVDLADLALEAAELHTPDAEARGIHMELDLNSALTAGDRTALTLAVTNLVQNAVRYGRAGGRVALRSWTTEAEAHLLVEDDGPGIPEAERTRLVQPFQRGGGLQGSAGAGLGLALVEAVAEQHSGHLNLGSSALGGLRAELHFRAAASERPGERASQSDPQPQQG